MLLKYPLTLTFFIFISLTELYAQSNVDSILTVLNNEIAHQKDYITKKENVVTVLKRQLKKTHDPQELFFLNDRIYNEYKSYQYDSAYVYSEKTLLYARKLNDKNLEVKAQSNLLFCFLSSGLFTEAVDIATSTSLEGVDAKTKAHFYLLCTRLYSDLTNFNDIKKYQIKYENMHLQYRDSALLYLKPSSYEYHDILIKNDLDIDQKIDKYQQAIDSFHIDNHQLAITMTDLANLYMAKKDTMQAIYCLAVSAINDTRSATMETTAKTILARYLYAKGNVLTANKYIYAALDEANFYHARHRMVSINSILPIIERAHLNSIEKQKSNLNSYLIGTTTLLILFLITATMVYLQNRKLNRAKSSINQSTYG